MKLDQSTAPRQQYHDLVRWDVLPHIPDQCGKVLDLGGGVGATSLELKQLNRADLVGVVDLVQQAVDENGLDFAYNGDLNDLDLLRKVIAEQGPFDTILALDILEHLVDPWAVVEVLHQGLSPDGILVASIPNVRNFRVTFPLIFRNRWEYRDWGTLDRTHLRFFVKSTAIELVTGSGLKLHKVAATTYGSRLVRLVRFCALGLLNSFTDRQYVILGRNQG